MTKWSRSNRVSYKWNQYCRFWRARAGTVEYNWTNNKVHRLRPLWGDVCVSQNWKESVVMELSCVWMTELSKERRNILSFSRHLLSVQKWRHLRHPDNMTTLTQGCNSECRWHETTLVKQRPKDYCIKSHLRHLPHFCDMFSVKSVFIWINEWKTLLKNQGEGVNGSLPFLSM